ncbi:MAG: hypothetical protein U0W24_11515 [Bacteroidales bacterium]
MKNLKIFLFLYLMLLGCKKDDLNPGLEGFNIIINNKVVLSNNDIEHYDFSSHLIYLYDTNAFNHQLNYQDNFFVYANGQEIYQGQFTPALTTVLSVPYITASNYYSANIVPINFMRILDDAGNQVNDDPRGDSRIVSVLKEFHKYHPGLECHLKSVSYVSENDVTAEIEIFNPDSYDYFIPDPDKMGLSLYHFFTYGLFFNNYNPPTFYFNNIETESPQPANTWKMEWITLIKSNETKTFTIHYDNFDALAPGQYEARFNFFGLNVDMDYLELPEGRIWQGFFMTEPFPVTIN